MWHQIEAVLDDPKRVAAEHERRIAEAKEGKASGRLDTMQRQLARLRRGIDRLIDSYAEERIDTDEFKPRLAGLKRRLAQLQADRDAVLADDEAERGLHLVIGRITDFAGRVHTSLEQLDWHGRREIIRALVRRIEIDQNQVEVVFRVPGPPTSPNRSDGNGSDHDQGDHPHSIRQHCGRSYHPAYRRRAARGQ